MNELISIVVPIYNVEKYLDRCLNSIVNQTYNNLEIILVDDGSTDSCAEICDRWAENDYRIKVIHKVNAGLGMARNTGIENANGQYVCFFDSDDYVDLSIVEKSLSTIKKFGSDIVVFGFSYVETDGSINKMNVESQMEYYTDNQVQEIFLPGIMSSDGSVSEIRNLQLSACFSMFSADLINKSGWKFVSEREIISEDIYSLLMLYSHVKSVAVLKESLYYYCENADSLTRTYRKDRFQKNKLCFKECLVLCDKYKYPQIVKDKCACSFIGNSIAALKQAVFLSKRKKDALEYIKEILNDDLFHKTILKEINNESRLKVKLFFKIIIHKCYRLCYLLVLLNKPTQKK